MYLADALLRLLLKRFRGRREIRIFVSEKLVGNLAGKQHADIRLFMIALQTRYIPIPARIVVISYVPSR